MLFATLHDIQSDGQRPAAILTRYDQVSIPPNRRHERIQFGPERLLVIPAQFDALDNLRELR